LPVFCFCEHSFELTKIVADKENADETNRYKTELTNQKTQEKEPAFVKLKLGEEKTDYGNYQLEVYNKNYGVDTAQIVDKSNLVFEKPEYRENAIKSLEKGNIVKVKFNYDDKLTEGKAILNPQYKNLNLYDNALNRLNTNKPLQGLENENKHEKSNVREQSMSRGI
jgi:hypothetical protein